jgi:glycosyltransferase involved in cell wall biosynthesis
MRIAIDARFLGSGTGIGRYVEQLVLNLEKIVEDLDRSREDLENQYFILINKENEDKYQPIKSNFKKVIVNIPWYGWEEQIKLPQVLKKIKPDLVHFPHFNVPFFYNQAFIVSIHDLILTKYPSRRATTLGPLKYFWKNLFYRLVIRHAIHKSRAVITMAEFTKKEIVEKFKIQNSKIKIIYEGVTKLRENNNEVDLKKYGINKDFVLYVGNAYPHKNLEFLVQAWKNLKEDYQLVLVGQPDYFYQRLEKMILDLNLKDKVILTGYLSDQELAGLYQQAQAYVFPSLCEGFGLPPLEAMQFNLPVLVSNTSCLPEILKDSALYFCPQNQDDFKEKLNLILSDLELRKKLIRSSQKLLLKYNWQKMAQQTKDIYNNL